MVRGYLFIGIGIVGMLLFGTYSFILYGRYEKRFKNNDFSKKLKDVKKEKIEIINKHTSSENLKSIGKNKPLIQFNKSKEITYLEDTNILVTEDETEILSLSDDTDLLIEEK